MAPSKDKKAYILGILCFLGLFPTWIASLWFITEELHQGNVYRIIYLHVPSAFCAFFCSFLLLIFSSLNLFLNKKTETRWFFLGRASAEVGLLFTALTLVTGSIWGKPTWGTWWTWDARLTTTFLLALLFCAYLLLASSMTQEERKERVCAVLGILIFVDVPIIYKSVSWWRTLHQPPSLTFGDRSVIDGDIYTHLILSILLMLPVCCWFVWQLYVNMSLKSELTQMSQKYLRGTF
jgi:heme exporter protein C